MKAWIVTWEWIGDHAARSPKIVSVLSPRLGARTVQDYIERLYADLHYSLEERARIAKTPTSNPYRAEFIRLQSGPRFEGRIECGHNPWLYGRLVDDLKVERDEAGTEHATWAERALPKGLR
jgi:hypothetical protein